jgi:hypothetical protein
MLVYPKNLETWHRLIILLHKRDIKRSQYLAPFHYNLKIRQQLIKIQKLDNVILHESTPQKIA